MATSADMASIRPWFAAKARTWGAAQGYRREVDSALGYVFGSEDTQTFEPSTELLARVKQTVADRTIEWARQQGASKQAATALTAIFGAPANGQWRHSDGRDAAGFDALGFDTRGLNPHGYRLEDVTKSPHLLAQHLKTQLTAVEVRELARQLSV